MAQVSEAGYLPTARIGSKRRIAIVASLCFLLAAAASALYLVRTVDNQLADITKAHEIRQLARELLLSVVDAETGQRGYLLSRDQRYLEPYTRAVASIDETYDRLLALVEDNQSQHLRIAALAPDIEAKRREMAQTISLVAANDIQQALTLVRSDTGEELMRSIRNAIRSFTAEEDARLLERNGQMQAYRLWLVAAILGALGAAAVLAYALFNRAQRQAAELAQQHDLLITENEQLEEHVRARTVEVEEARGRAERERARLEALLQDTNHRIGNSLATVSSLLGLQLTRSNSAEVREALEAAQGRVHAIASAHRRLRLGADLETANVSEFLDAVIDDLAGSFPSGTPIVIHRDVDAVIIPARDATTLGIVVSELVTNAMKHAFVGRSSGQIWVRFRRDENAVPNLWVEDDGVGLGGRVLEPTGSGLGAVIIKQLARQYGGVPEYGERDGGGTRVLVAMPQLHVTSG